MTSIATREPCPACREEGRDTAGDNLVRYEDGGAHCFACSYHEHGEGDGPAKVQVADDVDWEAVRGEVTPLPHRRVKADICRQYGYHTTTLNDKQLEIANYYDPATKKLIGQKIRRTDRKRFFCQGKMATAPLWGQHMWRDGGRRLYITEGEIDCLVVAQLLGGTWATVSVPNGAAGAEDAVKRNLEYVNSFDEVIICFDMDEQGREAALAVAKLLMPGKAKIVSLPRKDAAEMIKHGESRKLSSCLWEAKTYRPDGILHISEVAKRDRRRVKIYPFPHEGLNRVLFGQKSGAITMYTSGTGMGKSTWMRELAYHHLENGRKVGMIMLEEDPEETLHAMMSLSASKPIDAILAARALNDTLEEAGLDPIEFGVVDDLSDTEYEEHKTRLSQAGLYVYDHQGENLSDELMSKLEYMAVSLGCEVIILDHISVVVATMESGNERRDIDRLMVDLRSFVQRTGVHLDCVTQLRKTDGKPYEEGGRITLQDLRGSGSLSSVPNTVIAVERNQQNPNREIANTMLVRVLKDRFSGFTGPVIGLQYDPQTHRLKEVEIHIDAEGNLGFGPDPLAFVPEGDLGDEPDPNRQESADVSGRPASAASPSG